MHAMVLAWPVIGIGGFRGARAPPGFFVLKFTQNFVLGVVHSQILPLAMGLAIIIALNNILLLENSTNSADVLIFSLDRF